MARTFRQRRQMHAVAELNVTNLVDLAFTLLIIFMLATPLIQQEQSIPVDLPVESKSQQQKPDPDTKFESVTVLANGSYNLSGRVLSRAQLASEFASYGRKPKPPVFRIRMDAKSTAQQFIIVMDELKKANLSRITFDTQTQD